MFLRVLGGFLIGMILVNGTYSLAQSEDERRKGFYEQQKANKEFDQAREAGLKEYLKEQADWEEQRRKVLLSGKKQNIQESPRENGPEYKADRKEKLQDYEEYESLRLRYVKEKKALEPQNAKEQAKRNAWAMEEYELDKERPRFDITKRNLYGGKGGSSSPSGGYSGGSPGGIPNFPPPPAFDDFNGEGYVPPPFPPPESFEQPPDMFPPPPPPFPTESGSDFDSGGYFPPPPPPMPAPPEGFNNF